MEAEWKPISTAPKDGTPVLLAFKNPIPAPDRGEDVHHGFDGLVFVGKNHGPRGMGWNFAAPVGMGGFPDHWLSGWMPAPASPEPKA